MADRLQAPPELTSDGMARVPSLIRAGKLAEAQDVLRLRLADAPDDSDAHYQLGVIAHRRLDPVTAHDHFRRATRGRPDNAALRWNMASMSRLAGDAEGALGALTELLALEPGHARGHAELAGILDLLGRHGAAVSHARQAALLARASSDELTEIADRLLALDCASEAAACAARALEIDPKSLVARLSAANAHAMQGDSAGAVARYRAILADHPAVPAVLDNLGLVLLEQGALVEAGHCFHRSLRLRRGRPLNEPADAYADIPAVAAPSTASSRMVMHRLVHDLGQIEHLRHRELLPGSFDHVAGAYRALIGRLGRAADDMTGFDLAPADLASIGPWHDRLVRLDATGWRDQPAVNPSLDAAGIEDRWDAANPHIVTVDGLLTGEALEALHRFCLNSTIWFEAKGAGYLGAYMKDGFNDPLLLRIVEELRQRLPGILGRHTLRKMWAYSYAAGMHGINPHADFAAVNVNFWITPDSANLDPDSGGLIVYPKPVPAGWSFRDYNAAPADRIYEFLGPARAAGIRIPYRQRCCRFRL